MSRGEELLWERELPFTFLAALVDEDGSVAGYGVSEGLGVGDLLIAVLAPDGTPWAEERRPRSPRTCMSPENPRIASLERCREGFALEVLVGSEVHWWIYDRASGRRVAEQQAAPDAPDLPVVSRARTDTPPEIPLLEAPLLGRVVFPWPLPNAALDRNCSHESHRVRRPDRVFVDRTGRIWMSELFTRLVHVFEPTGIPLFERAPDPAHFRPYRPVEWMRVREDGSLVVCADGAVEGFGPSGSRGPRGIDDHSTWEFVPGSSSRWQVGRINTIAVVSEDGRVLVSHERAPNGRWLEVLSSSTVDVDGTLAVLDVPFEDSRDASAWVHLFIPGGRPVRSVRIPVEFHVEAELGSALAIQRGLLALLSNGEVLFADTSGSVLGRAPLSEEARDARSLFFSTSGTELWVFPPGRAEMLRYAVPRSSF